jgi:glutamine amidotransferase
MCELFGMSARIPTDVNRSLALLRPRGGEIGPHADGWGAAFYEGPEARVFKEAGPAWQSPFLDFITQRDYRSSLVVGHIRKANPPRNGRTIANTHPFARELNGRAWVFAHNGVLSGLHADERFALKRFEPIGGTDSEHAFCYVLQHVARETARCEIGTSELLRMLREPLAALDSLGELNVLMSDGERLIAYANTRLWFANRECRQDGCGQRVVLLATDPLTDEPWRRVQPGKIHVFAEGRAVS